MMLSQTASRRVATRPCIQRRTKAGAIWRNCCSNMMPALPNDQPRLTWHWKKDLLGRQLYWLAS